VRWCKLPPKPYTENSPLHTFGALHRRIDCKGWYIGKEVIPKCLGASDTELCESHYFSNTRYKLLSYNHILDSLISCGSAQLKYGTYLLCTPFISWLPDIEHLPLGESDCFMLLLGRHSLLVFLSTEQVSVVSGSILSNGLITVSEGDSVCWAFVF
jgi:hypothetical protein